MFNLSYIMRKKKISISDLSERIKNYTFSHGSTRGKVIYTGEIVMGTDLEMHYLFNFPQGIATDNTQCDYPNRNEEGLDEVENGVGILKSKLKDPDLEIIYIKRNKRSADIEIKREKKESSLEKKAEERPETEKTISETVSELYTISDSTKELYKHLKTINNSPFSLTCLSQTRIDEKNGIVYVSSDFVGKKIKERYGRAINNKLGQIVEYIRDPILENKRHHINLDNI